MNEALRVAARLVEGMSPLDVAACLVHLRGELPARRFPALDQDSGDAFLDFEFADGDLASAYLRLRSRELCAAERKAHMAAIARCIAEADLALEERRPHGRVRAAVRLCRNREKVLRLGRLIRESEARGVDLAFIRDAVL
ncbi:hypothetical protein SB87_gp061 [Parapoxvirus red deer/HL953]|uniref:Uncharacterized protein n=1 Tax=Parapoxvirus red deer/HL953 TaxID=1579460 RepID=A0A0A7M9Z1_9POXV|nr:hypothetical protein SB87_gp061 [Parapoxvirus red deer/HL953]AIZ77314.1 hypothetical protein [Parapoxvirus red deer/HL953]